MILAMLASIVGLAAAAPLVDRGLPRAGPWLMALFPAGAAAWLLAAAPGVLGGTDVLQRLAWAPDLGVTLAFRLDGLALLMALLVTGVGALVTVYAGEYLAGDPRRGRFFATLMGFMAAMLGLVLADNVLAMFMFWEATSVTSYLLIGFDHHREAARKAALQALLTTALGGLALFAGFVLLGVAAGGRWEVSAITQALGEGGLAAHPWYGAVLALVLIGAFTKSAQFPFSAWLPGAMAAPTPVSAYLHSATMVKAGVYLLARLCPILGGTPAWTWSLAVVGGLTAVTAAWAGFRETIFKRVLAYSTVSSLGLLVMLLGLAGSPAAGLAAAAAGAAVAYLLAHALFKGSLFLVAGVVDHATHEKDSAALSGLARAMPLTATAAALAGLSLAGVPGWLGFAGKELGLKAGAAWDSAPWLAPAVLGVAGALSVVFALQLAWGPFFRRSDASPGAGPPAHEGGAGLLAGPLTLAALGVALALAPGTLGATALVHGAAASIAPWAASVAGAPAGVHLDLPALLKPGAPLAISLGAVVLGLLLYAARDPLRRAAQSTDALSAVGPARLYHAAYAAVLGAARGVTNSLHRGTPAESVRYVLAALLALGAWAMWRGPGSTLPLSRPAGAADAPATWPDLVLAGLMVAGAAGVGLASRRTAAVAALGVTGYCVAVVFLVFGSPDVAMTQFGVETLTVVLFVLVLYHLPRLGGTARGGGPTWLGSARRWVDVALAGGCGLVMGALLLTAADSRVAPSISGWFAENAVEGAKGRNVVNVIIVDFRALDTMGEITVLGVAALGVLTLLRVRSEPRVDERRSRHAPAAPLPVEGEHA